MLEFVLNTIFWTLAIYGLFEVIKNIIYISKYTKFKSDGIYVIIAVKNQEEKIEGFIRSILFIYNYWFTYSNNFRYSFKEKIYKRK